MRQAVCMSHLSLVQFATTLVRYLPSTAKQNFVEGAYLRIDDEEKGVNTTRGKIVRPDFIQNINEGEHWIKGEMVKNQVRPDLWVELS